MEAPRAYQCKQILGLHQCASPDSCIHAVINWIILCCYTGFWKSEWCSNHPSTFTMINHPNWVHRPKALPIIADNFSFIMEAGKCAPNVYTHGNATIVFTSLCI